VSTQIVSSAGGQEAAVGGRMLPIERADRLSPKERTRWHADLQQMVECLYNVNRLRRQRYAGNEEPLYAAESLLADEDSSRGYVRPRVPYPPLLGRLETLLRSYRYDLSSERSLQDGIERVLREESIEFERECVLGPGEHIDFLIGGIGVEVKIKGSLSSVTRQLMRYALSERITAVLLVTSRMQHAALPGTLRGKPVRLCCLVENLL